MHEKEKYKHDYFLMFRHRILKQIKDEKNAEVDELLLDRRRNSTWTKKALLFLIMKHVYSTFVERKKAVELAHKRNVSAIRIGKKVRNHLWRKAPRTVQKRLKGPGALENKERAARLIVVT